MQTSKIENRRKFMMVVVGLALCWIAVSPLLFGGIGTDQTFYSILAAGIVASIAARLVWRCPYCKAWLGKGWTKESCKSCGKSFAPCDAE